MIKSTFNAFNYWGRILLSAILILSSQCSISNEITRPINIPILTAVRSDAGGHLINATLHNFESGFSGYRLLQSPTEIPSVLDAACPSQVPTCVQNCCDCINLNRTPNVSASYVIEVLNSPTLMNTDGNQICAMATRLQSGNHLALFVIVSIENNLYQFSNRSNQLQVP